MSAPDIFLSYNREDMQIAKVYADAFAQVGLEVWWDATLHSGEAYDEVTEAALREAKAVVVLWSPRSVVSRWVRAEATIADRNKTLMPVTIEPCERPVMFELKQTADLSHWRGEADDKAWLAFLGDVRRLVGRREDKSATIKPASASAGTGSGASLVAVLPITCRGNDEELELLAEDLTEEITRELAHNGLFEVIAAGTLAGWRGKAIDHRALGRELGARYIVESKLQRSGEEVRLTIQLIDTAAGRILWSQRIDRKLAEVAASPDALPWAAANELGAHIHETEVNRAMTKLRPYSGREHLLRCSRYMTPGSANARSAIEEARKAVAALPNFGLAHAMLAAALGSLQTSAGQSLDNGLNREIHTHVARAIQLDRDNPGVILCLSATYGFLGDGEAALRLALRAVEIEPNSPSAHYCLGVAYFGLGRNAEAITAFKQQGILAPHDSTQSLGLLLLGMCQFLEGQPTEAEAALDRSLALTPNSPYALKWKAIMANERGDEPAALAMVRRLREAEPTMAIDQHLRSTPFTPKLAEHTAGYVSTLRRLWDATEGDA